MKPANQLLTPELDKKTREVVQKCLDTAKAKYPDLDFPMPEIKYDVKNSIGGLAYHQEWKIRLNLVLFIENEAHFLAQTVPHEVAHLIAHRVHSKNPRVNPKTKQPIRIRSHGKEWAEVMTLLKIPADKYHTYDLTSIQPRTRKNRSSQTSIEESARQLQKLRRLKSAIKNMSPSFRTELQEFLLEINTDTH